MTALALHDMNLAWVDPAFEMPDWMRESRQQHFNALQQQGFPTKKVEQFRYTDLTRIEQQLSQGTTHHSSSSFQLNDKLTADSIRFVFRNHVFHPEQSDLHLLPKGVIACTLQEAILHHEPLLKTVWPSSFDAAKYPFACLNLASFQQGFFLYVPKNTILNVPLYFMHVTDQTNTASCHELNLLLLEEGCELALFEEVRGLEHSHFHNLTQVVLLEKNTRLHHVLLQHTHTQALNYRTSQVALKEGAHTTFVSCLLGGEFTRHDYTCQLHEPFATCNTSSFYHAQNKQYIDNHVEIVHHAHSTTSDMLFKGTLTDQAKVVFNGRLYVEKNAQKIVAHQENHHLLFSNQAESYAKPELEIYADDVKCKHGATTAAFDDDAIFYLRSRGLSEDAAKQLLLNAYVQSILDRVLLPDAFIDHIRLALEDIAHDL